MSPVTKIHFPDSNAVRHYYETSFCSVKYTLNLLYFRSLEMFLEIDRHLRNNCLCSSSTSWLDYVFDMLIKEIISLVTNFLIRQTQTKSISLLNFTNHS